MEATIVAELIQQYLLEQMMPVVVALMLIGLFIKKSPKIADWLIVWILPGIGTILSFLLLGLTAEAFIQGILAGGLAVFFHQAYKQTKERK
jgi:hypothetical protein